jgi:membrane protease YdiL (CAAX protease family)
VRERLTAADHRFLLICVLLLALTVWFSATYFYRAFPEASIDFAVTRGQSLELAQHFLTSQGYQTAGYREAGRFNYDDRAKTFLERELGLEKANQLMGRRVRLWRWSHRWFRPLQKEEFRVEVTTRGETVGFEHLLPETSPGANLPAADARAIAEGFLRQTMGRDAAGLDFVESSTTARPKRTDHVFTWKERGFDIKDATYRMQVTVLGDRVGGYEEYLKVPEAWTRDYDRLRSANETAGMVDAGLLVLLVLGGLAVFVIRIRNRDVRWGRAAIFGLVTAALSFLASCNNFPLTEFQYPTTDSYASFLANHLVQAVLAALASGGFIFLLAAWAEPLYRESYGRFLSLGNLFRWRGLRTKSFLRGSVLGITLAGIFIAYQTAFYMVAYRFGAWSPADVPYDDLLNTRFPWLFVLFGGFFPAVSEEFLFRMFSIPFLKRLFRWSWLAVVLAGFSWGFGHAGYPQQPFFIRGLEVGIGGVALGIIMLRWGILPTLVWHYSVDAMYSALLLLRSHNLYFVLSGAASGGLLLIPVLVAGLAYLRFKGFEPEAGLTNASEGTSQPPPEKEEAAAPIRLPYQPWPQRRILAAAALVAALAAFLLIPVERSKPTEFALNPQQARAAAGAFVKGLRLDPNAFRDVVYSDSHFDALTGEYFLERQPVSFLNKMAGQYSPLVEWVVRYYKPLEKEEIRVGIDPGDGQVTGFVHELPEDRPGAELDFAAAEQIASAYLAGRGFDLQKLELKEHTTEKRKARRDYSLTWEAKPGDPRNLDEARYRIGIDVDGDRVARFTTFWKLPEAFTRERERRNLLETALMAIEAVVVGIAVLIGLWVVVMKTRQRELRWKPVLMASAAIAALSAAGSICSYPLLFRRYPTDWALPVFRATMVVTVLIGIAEVFIVAAFGVALLVALRPDIPLTMHAPNRRGLGRDALFAVVVALAAAGFAAHFRALLTDRFHAQALVSISAPTVFATLAPALAAISSAATHLLLWLAIVALAVHIPSQYLKRGWLAGVAALLAVTVAVPGDVHTAGEFLLQYAIVLVEAGLVAAVCFWFARRNYLAYALAVWSLLLGRSAYEFLSQPSPSLRTQGWIVAAVLAVTLAWAAAPLRKRANGDGPD